MAGITAQKLRYLSAFRMVSHGALLVIRRADWADPRHLIPLTGMVLGNSRTAVHLHAGLPRGTCPSQVSGAAGQPVLAFPRRAFRVMLLRPFSSSITR